MSVQLGHFHSTVKNFKIAWKVWQPETEAQAVIHLVHGYSEHIDRYLNLVNELLAAGYIICGTDHRGHGRSEGRRGHVEKFTDFISDEQQFRREIIDRQFAGLPCFMLGHSMGSVIALRYALEAPAGLKGLVLSGTGARSGHVVMSPLLRLVARLGSKLCPTLPTRFPLKPDFISRDAEVVKAYEEDPLVFNVCTPRLGEQMDTYIARNFAEAGRLRLPVLMQCGTADISFDGQADLAVALGSPDKTFLFYEGLRHEVYGELPQDRARVFGDLRKWLDSHR